MASPFPHQRWLGEQIAFLFLMGFVFLMGLVVVYFSAQNRRSSRRRERPWRNEYTFADDLLRLGFDTKIARATYRYLQARQHVGFPIEPSDDLDRDLGLDEEDLKQTVQDLLAVTGREYLPGLLRAPLVTVEDLMRYIQASPRRESDMERTA